MWSSRLQKLHALSTAESEIYAATEAVKDASYLKILLHQLGVRDDEAMPVHEDNAACRIMGEQKLKYFRKARHYITRLGFLQDMIGNETVKFIQTDTENMVADALTKPLTIQAFGKFRDIMVQNVRKL